MTPPADTPPTESPKKARRRYGAGRMTMDLDMERPSAEAEKKRQKREFLFIALLIVTVGLISYAISKTSNYGANFPISNTLMMFILININMMLLLTLIILVFRNLTKLYFDRRKKAMGSKLRVKLVIAFITLTLVPSVVLFYFSMQFISTSIAYWFNAPVEQALENSLSIGRELYNHIEKNNTFFLERITYQLDKKYLAATKKGSLSNYIVVSQRAFNIDAIEVYGKNTERLTFSISSDTAPATLNPIAAGELQKSAQSKGVHTVIEESGGRELIRSIATVPFGAERQDARAYVVITIRVSRELVENISSVTRGFEEYQQIKLMKKPIRTTYFIALSIVALLVLFCAIWFAFYLARSITIPIMELAKGTRRVAEGDLSFHIDVVSNDEIGSLVVDFNKMTRDLGISREQLALSARMLKEQNLEIEEQRQYMEIVLQSVSAGVISLDPSGHVATINKSAERMLQVKSKHVIRHHYTELLGGQENQTAKEISEKLENSGNGINFPVSLAVNGKPRSFNVHSTTLRDDNGNPMGLVIVFDDMTELEKIQRLAAWREVARRIAHEVKNPLTPIALSAERLKRRYSKVVAEPVFDECTRTIIEHVDLIRNLVNSFASFARFPTANPEPCELPPIVEDCLVLYREGLPDIEFTVQFVNDIPLLNLDRQLIKQALINLIENAVAAVRGRGRIALSLSYNSLKQVVTLEVADSGTGIPDPVKARLFEPYFSTKKSGTGLGLAIVNSIVSDHNAEIRVLDNDPSGTRFVIEFPVQAPA
ncbi:ATP-binding protein [Desulfoluna spongiiphila]|uniref:histidine kinase n=1 Tax=Desulfoluna spongiiphila TaxID=419481 RepID=A0A1G5I3V3_9BACT|nr:ATP-binding protein [Desulfoluna spongiiphila]SCY70330.1 PAS/PAC sensor signal transduction histidine kinase [Desulfoluna spongiiphila]VVS92674.1 signal transduction histidine kinase nitrogen fixation and metabolism regulator [Desulfoluna spongiiphila]